MQISSSSFNQAVEQLSSLPGIKVYPSMTNFVLVELLNNKSSFDFCMQMLVDYQIYLRDCSDKIGLEGNFLRIAARSNSENEKIVSALGKLLL